MSVFQHDSTGQFAEVEFRSPFRIDQTESPLADEQPFFGEQDVWDEDEAGLPGDDEDAWGSENNDEVAGLDPPENIGAPFAPDPPPGAAFPVRSSTRRAGEVAYRTKGGRSVGNASRRFGAPRSNGQRRHAGIDLYADFGDEVVACQDGTILAYYPFCCGKVKTTSALVVDHHDLVINYGEVAPDSLKRLGLARGSTVTAGQVIAFIGRNPGGSSMLHFEAYAAGTTKNIRWPAGSRPPVGLLDPTRYLLALSPTAPRSPAPPGSGIGRPVLRRGSSRPEVRDLQDALNRAGFTVVVDGIFGPATLSAVRAFQRTRNLAVDGVVGTKTWAALSVDQEYSSDLGMAESYDLLASEAEQEQEWWTEVSDEAQAEFTDEAFPGGAMAGEFGLYDGLQLAGLEEAEVY